MQVNYAKVEEPTLDPKTAHSFIDRPLPNHVLLHFAHHDGSCSQLVCNIATLLDSILYKKYCIKH